MTLKLTDNYQRKVYGFLDQVVWAHSANPVVKVTHEASGELVYALRIQGNRFKPWVFEKGSYRVEIGDPERDDWQVVEGQVVQ